MRRFIETTILAVVVTLVWVAQPNPAAAERVEATRKVRLMSRPGEKSRVVKRVPSGRSMKVLDRKGRWIKVLVGSQSGWVTRTSVREVGERQARTVVRKTRRHAFVDGRSSKRRGWSEGVPEDRIGADTLREGSRAKRERRIEKKARVAKRDRDEDRANDDEDSWGGADADDADDAAADADDADVGDDSGGDEDWGDEEEEEPAKKPEKEMVVVTAEEAEIYARPSSHSDTQFVAEQGDKLYFVSRSDSGRWVEVENDSGDTGWIRAKHVEQKQSFRYQRMNYFASGGLGYTALGMNFASDGVGQLANYQMTSAAASVVIGGDLIYAGGSKTRLIGGDLQYRGTRATPGIRYDDGAGNVADIGFTMHEVDVGASYGYRFQRNDGLALFARGGYHYGQFQIHNVEDTASSNLARLPSELLKGFTVGGRAIAPRLTKTIGASLEAEYLLGGTRTQTVGLEDGATSRVSAGWAIGQVAYQWKPDLQLVATYRYFFSNTEWAGQATGSMRTHNATQAKRKDVIHTVSLGVGKTF